MKQRSLTEGNILSTLTGFAMPVLAALFLQSLYGAVDLMVVGQFATTADVSGVATGSMLTGTVMHVVTGMALGVTVLVAEAIGRKHPEEAGGVIGTSVCLFSAFAALLMVLLTALAEPLSRVMQAPADAYTQTIAYVRICGAGSIFIIAYNVIGAVFRGIGDSRTPLMTVAIACVFNIAADLLLVAVLGMGASGAALATVCSQAVSVLASLLIIRRRKLPFTMVRRDIRFNRLIVRRVVRLGSPVALQDLLVGSSFLFIQSVVNAMGLIASASVGVGEKVCGFLMLVGSAYSQSMSAFAAQNMAAGKRERANRGLWCGIITAEICGIVLGLGAFFAGDVLASMFDSTPAVVAGAHSYLKAYAIDCVLTPFLFCFIGYFNGREKTMFVMLQGLVGAFLVRIPFVWFASRMPGATLFTIGLGTPSSTILQIILCFIVYIRLMQTDRKQTLEQGNA